MYLTTRRKLFSRIIASALLLLLIAWILTSKDILVNQPQIFQVKSGSSIGEVAQELSEKKIIKSKRFFTSLSRLLNANKKLKSGYYELKPDTSIFNYGESIENVLKKSHETMKLKLTELWENRDKSIPLDSPYQAIILASLIENETALDNEKPMISSVFIGRLNSNMRLQTDPTVIYALGDQYKPPLTRSDLKFDHPYNTYRNKGLPPGAISSVGYHSLFAALHPAKGSALYFVSKKDGSHAFAETYDEHKENIKKYLKAN